MDGSNGEPPKKQKRKEKQLSEKMSIDEYLFLKSKREEEKKENTRQRWEEEKKLKEAEIEAIKDLAKAITMQIQSQQK